MNWKLIHQRNQEHNNHDSVRNNTSRVDHDNHIGDKVVLINIGDYKYETPYKGSYKIIQYWTNVTATQKMSDITDRLNILEIKP